MNGDDGRPTTVDGKRKWLHDRLIRPMTDRTKIRDAEAKLNRMAPAQLDALIDQFVKDQRELQKILAQQQILAQRRARQNALRAWQQRQQWGHQRGVGYMPVVTWLPEGAALRASAVVSPDRRYVRINATPFFSSIGPVHTFNYHTGQTRVYPPPGNWNPGLPQYRPHAHHTPRSHKPAGHRPRVAGH